MTMKKLFALSFMPVLLFVAFALSACDDDDDDKGGINALIVEVVRAEVPGGAITDVDRVPTGYEVDVVRAGVKYEVYLTSTYEWMGTEMDITWAGVPEPVKQALAADGYTFNEREDEAEEVTVPNGEERVTFIKIELDREPTDIVLRYNVDGTPYHP